MQRIPVHDTDEEILVPFGNSGTFLRGRHFEVRSTSISSCQQIPREYLLQMIGLQFPVVLTGEQVIAQCGESFQKVTPPGTAIGYAQEIAKRLKELGKPELAGMIEAIARKKFDMWIFEVGTFEIID